MGIDKNPEAETGLEVTVQIATHHNLAAGGGEGGEGKPFLVTTVRGNSISSIFNKLENMVNGPLFFGNTMLLVISRK